MLKIELGTFQQIIKCIKSININNLIVISSRILMHKPTALFCSIVLYCNLASIHYA